MNSSAPTTGCAAGTCWTAVPKPRIWLTTGVRKPPTNWPPPTTRYHGQTLYLKMKDDPLKLEEGLFFSDQVIGNYAAARPPSTSSRRRVLQLRRFGIQAQSRSRPGPARTGPWSPHGPRIPRSGYAHLLVPSGAPPVPGRRSLNSKARWYSPTRVLLQAREHHGSDPQYRQVVVHILVAAEKDHPVAASSLHLQAPGTSL